MRSMIPSGLVLAFSVAGTASWAQTNPWGDQTGTGANSPASAAAVANPMMNPLMNPYLNPAAAMRPMDRNSMIYYMMQAQNAKGGIGSGQLSGSRKPPGEAKSDRKVSHMPRSSNVPGSGASKYFQRGLEPATGPSTRNNRQIHYFNDNGH